MRANPSRLCAGDVVTPRELPTLSRDSVSIPDPNSIVHLQFRRYAGCPICQLHLREFATRHDELGDAGVHEVVVFHSTRDDLARFQAQMPFDVVPDPSKALYREFRVGRSIRSIAHPSSWLATVRGWSPRLGIRAGTGGHLGMPADFLIAPDAALLAVKYGAHANDAWTADEVIALVGR